jgi:hypothetical protein
MLSLGISIRRRPSEWAFFATLLLYCGVAIVVYFWLVQPWIAGDINIRIGADSDRYWDAAKGMAWYGQGNLLSLTGNFLGPVLIALALKSGFAVMCFNFILFGIALSVAASIEGVRTDTFGFLMLLNAELFPALTTLNKEIFALLAAVLTAKFLYSGSRSKILLLLAFLASVFARWEQAAILLVFLVFYYFRPFRGRPKIAILTLIVGLTVIYPLLFSIFGIDPAIFDYLIENAHTIVRLDAIQASYGFPIVLIPKIFMLVAGTLATPWNYWSGEFLRVGFEDIQQTVFQPLGCLLTLILLVVWITKGRFRLSSPISLLIAVTLIVGAVAPFIQPRYAYPVYVLLCLELARSNVASLHSGERCRAGLG